MLGDRREYRLYAARELQGQLKVKQPENLLMGRVRSSLSRHTPLGRVDLRGEMPLRRQCRLLEYASLLTQKRKRSAAARKKGLELKGKEGS